MGVAKKTRKFAQVKRIISRRDNRLKENAGKADAANPQKAKTAGPSNEVVREIPQLPSSLFFQHNEALKPPYSVLVDTNFLSHTVQRKLPLLESMMDCLYAKCVPIITSCVMAEIARDERWERIQCAHKGTYADDCIVDRVMKHRVYIVATNDKDLIRRIRKIPGVPVMNVARGKYVIERLPGAPQ
ncbi:Uu.00g089550.m01.CDS01 [Anthostomella pinea]|uniref:Uu.00g089550.m01.CDS01 n=1 Tax=Anthostomella pinea TaxID=933095 RepID=A0AAI8YHS9_9PEZI|nr:Uu.00g089550.m01.CDS01 [Anthostomella pinea]